MKNYTYETRTGMVTIEVDEHWHRKLMEADAKESNSNRCHTRSDHKYAPGEPISLNHLEYWIADIRDDIALIELAVDLERALSTLTKLQHRYFTMARLHGYSCAQISKLEGKADTTILRTVSAAEKKLKKFLVSYMPDSASPTAI